MGRAAPDEPRPTRTDPLWPSQAPLSLAEPHVLVDTDEGPSAGLLIELDGDRARVVYAWDDETGGQGLMETWLPAEYVRPELPRVPAYRLPRVPTAMPTE